MGRQKRSAAGLGRRGRCHAQRHEPHGHLRRHSHPEIWRYKGKKLRVYLLHEDGDFREPQASDCFPYLDMAKVNEFLHMAPTMDETALLRKFTAWVRREV